MRVHYFSWLRERLGRDFDEVQQPETVNTIGDLIDWLAEDDEGFALAAANRQMIRAAIDDELVDHQAQLGRAANVALFPPMTGG